MKGSPMRGTGNRVKKKSKPPDQAKQSQRFVETAKALEVEDGGKSFENAIKKVLPKKKPRTRRREPDR